MFFMKSVTNWLGLIIESMENKSKSNPDVLTWNSELRNLAITAVSYTHLTLPTNREE